MIRALPWGFLGAGLGGLLLGAFGGLLSAFIASHGTPGFVVGGGVGAVAGFVATLQLATSIMERRKE